MSNDGPSSSSDDPATVVALIYRIVDQPRRGFTCAALLFPVLATMSAIDPTAALGGLPVTPLWWSVAGVLVCPLLVRAAMRLLRQVRNVSNAEQDQPVLPEAQLSDSDDCQPASSGDLPVAEDR